MKDKSRDGDEFKNAASSCMAVSFPNLLLRNTDSYLEQGIMTAILK